MLWSHSDGTDSRRAILHVARREPSCPPWEIPLADILRVYNAEHTQHSLFMTIPALPNDGIHAKDIEVCLWLLFNIFHVNACL